MAQLALSAKVPAPMMPESPTRPQSWFTNPPVEVAAARLPDLSRATALTVSGLFLFRLRMTENGRMLTLCLCQLLNTRFGHEVANLFIWYAVLPGELFGAFAD
jgi:hypothetical protein